jgi:hypothetical protein
MAPITMYQRFICIALPEFDYRYNTRKITDGERTQKAIQMTTGKRLM